MRPLIFKGKSIDSGKWITGSLLQLNDQAQIVNHETSALVDPDTIGQYTGKKDRYGKEICEGDILDFYDEECKNPKHLCGERLEVFWDNNQARFGYGDLVAYAYQSGFERRWLEDTYVVIGNIHDNPELLKKSNEPE